jgi:hypothetical protein
MDEPRPLLEPWARDLAELGERTAADLPSCERTLSFVLASASREREPNRRKEKTMTLIRRRPLLATAVALVLLAGLTGAAYAVVNKIFLSIDPDRSQEEIADAVRAQLEEAGVKGPSVDAIKHGDTLVVGIKSADRLSAEDLDVKVEGKKVEACDGHDVTFRITGHIGEAQKAELVKKLTSDAFLAIARETGDAADEQHINDRIAAAIVQCLKDCGYDADVTVRPGEVAIDVRSSPAP